MVAAGANTLMAGNESTTSKSTENSITQFGAHHHHHHHHQHNAQQLAGESALKKGTRSSLLDSSRKKESPSTSANRTTSIRETKTSRLRAASIISPADGSKKASGLTDNIPSWNSPQSSKSTVSYASGITSVLSREKEGPRRVLNRTLETQDKILETSNFDKSLRRSKRLSGRQNNSTLYNNQSPLMTHRQYEAKEVPTRQKINQQNTTEPLTRPSSTILSTSQIPKRTPTRAGSHDSTEVLQRVDALTALTKATMERVERLTSSSSSSLSASSSSHANTTNITSDCCTTRICSTKKLQKSSSITSTNTNKKDNNYDEIKSSINRNQPLISILKHKSIDISDTNGTELNNYHQQAKTSFDIDENPVKKLGILKKRSSLDENEILRRSKCRSPDFVTFEGINGASDTRPILKIERRSSLDELSNTKLSKSPDYPASILKRKWSRSREEDHREDVCSPELQSILKKYQNRNDGKTSNYSSNILMDNTVKSLGVTWTDNDMNQEVRPILKKKLSREESSSSDPPSLEPRPILKKKSSTESDDHDDKPKKTILKTSRRSSDESNNETEINKIKNTSVLKNHSLQRRTNSLPECDSQLITVKPILKNSNNYIASDRLSRFDFITTKNNNLLRKRARSVGPDVYNDSEDIITLSNYDTIKPSLLDEKYPSHNTSSLSPSSSSSSSSISITPIVSFKLSSRDESLIYSETNDTEEITMNSKEINLRKLDEYAAKLRRSRHISRRLRNGENPILSSPDISKVLSSDVKIDNNDIKITEESRIKIINIDQNIIHQSEKLASIVERKLRKNQDDDDDRENNITDILKETVNVSTSKANDQLQNVNEIKLTTVINNDVKDVLHRTHDKLNGTKEQVHISYKKNINCDYGHNETVEKSKSSLTEQVGVFNQRISIDTFFKADESVNRVQKRPFSRFRTQPVTSEEVEDAARYIPNNNITDSKRTPSDKLVNQAIQPPKSILKSSSSHILSANIQYKKISDSHSSVESSEEEEEEEEEEETPPLSPVVLRRNFRYTKSDLYSDDIDNKNEDVIVPLDDYTECSVNYKKILKNTKERVLSVDESDDCRSQVNCKNQLLAKEDCCVKSARPMSATMQSLNLPSISIRDRLAALQRSGSTDWKRRVTSEPITASFIIEKKNTDNTTEKSGFFQKEKDEIVMKQGRLADRLEKLESATEGWRKRVTAADAVQFSVAGKMRVDQIDTNTSVKPIFESMGNCVSDRKKKVPKTKEVTRKAEGVDGVTIEQADNKKILENISKKENGDEIKNKELQSIQYVPRADDETFTSFFDSMSVDKCREESLDVTEDDFNLITSFSERLGSRRTTQVQRRRIASSRNPLRTLAARTDLKEEYTEIKMGVADRMIKLNNIEKLGQNSSLAVEALAGLASTENFSAVTLKDAEKTNNGMRFDNKLRPLNSDLMLIIIKGRRHVQVRLIEPIASNINSGDNYILFTKSEIFNYVGKYSNVIERSRAAEIALRILQNKDLGCRANRVITIYEEKENDNILIPSSNVRKFWKLLGSDKNPEIIDAGHPDEDEFYESTLIDTNVVYELSNNKLIPLDKYWGMLPKIKMLDPSKSLVFDFGSEMYIWNGKCVPMEKRKIAIKLAEQLWNEGFDYTECAVSPINAASIIGNRKSTIDNNKKSDKRPNWCLLVKLTQHMETILFREKFLDWPNVSGVIKLRRDKNKKEGQVDSKITIEPPNVNFLISSNEPDVDLILEGCHLGRGTGWFDEEFKRQYIVATSNVSVWHIEENAFTLIRDSSSIGQFFSGDSYIVRWMYTITVTGRGLTGLPSKHAVEGRDRCAYFIWQGKNASLNKQGTAALLTVELDKEEGPQIRISEGFEPAAFLNLFDGKMIIHSGKKSEANKIVSKKVRAYMCRGTKKSETFLVEVPCSTKQLRSRGSLIFINKKKRLINVWHGKHSLSHIKKNVLHAANQLKNNKPTEVGFNHDDRFEIREIDEGDEPDDLFEASMNNKKLHGTLTKTKKMSSYTPRLFHFSSISGEFTATELFCLHRGEDTTPFPFLQEELYQVNQPALFLFDNKDELWLWQGWWPDTGSDDQTGSGAIRWQAERRAAMTVAIEYWKKQHLDVKKCPVYLVWAGLEPLEFINLFSTWTYRDEIAELNIQDGRAPGQILSVESELARLTQSTYPPAQLLQRPLPEGVDPTSLELYLSPQHFQELLGMNISEFKKLPSWKQIDIKKKIGLF